MYQKIIIVGRLGRDPEMRFTPTGQAVTDFSVAVDDKDKTTWFRVTAWEKLAETCAAYLTKGKLVLVLQPLSERLSSRRSRAISATTGIRSGGCES